MVKIRHTFLPQGDARVIRLCLANNDPTSTLLVTDSGKPLYSISTVTRRPCPENSQQKSVDVVPSILSCRKQRPLLLRSHSLPSHTRMHKFHHGPESKTTIKRMDGFDVSTGQVESTIGVIRSLHCGAGAKDSLNLCLCQENVMLALEGTLGHTDSTTEHYWGSSAKCCWSRKRSVVYSK